MSLIGDARQTLADEAAAAEAARKRRDRVLFWLVALVAVGAAVVSVLAATTRSEDVAAQVAPQVAERVVQDARQARVDTGRRELGEANTQLVARNLPIVGDPGDGATGDELVIAAATARVLSILPESTVGRLRDEVRSGRTPPVLPSAARLGDLPVGDQVVTVLPEPGSPSQAQVPDGAPPRVPARPGARPAPAPRAPATRPAPAPRAPSPAPAPANRDRGLCLLGVLLCER